MNPQQTADDVFLNSNDAAQIRKRIPDKDHLPQPPSRDNGIMLTLPPVNLMVPPLTPFILVYEDNGSIADAPVRVLLDSTADSIIGYCLTDGRYVAYSHNSFTTRLTQETIKLVNPTE